MPFIISRRFDEVPGYILIDLPQLSITRRKGWLLIKVQNNEQPEFLPIPVFSLA